MDSGAAGHVMLEAMFPRVRLESKTSPKKFVAANGEQIKELGEKSIPFKTHEEVQRCITFRSASVAKPLISMQKVVRARNIVVLDEKNPHIRNIRDRTMIKLDVNNERCVHNGYVDLPQRNRSSFQLPGTVSGQTAFGKLVRPSMVCRGEEAENENWKKLKEQN